MNSYSIFAIVLTVAYLIYYAVIVAHDLYGKKKMCKTSEEVFDLGVWKRPHLICRTRALRMRCTRQ